jgi:fructokinase
MNEAESEAFYDGLLHKKPQAGESELSDNTHNFQKICLFFEELSGRLSGKLSGGKQYPVFVIKRGAAGAVCFAEGNVHHAVAEEAIPVETTGAGDTFAAAFLAAWVRNRPIAECAEIGNKTARIILDSMGTRVNSKQLEKMARLLK